MDKIINHKKISNFSISSFSQINGLLQFLCSFSIHPQLANVIWTLLSSKEDEIMGINARMRRRKFGATEKDGKL